VAQPRFRPDSAGCKDSDDDAPARRQEVRSRPPVALASAASLPALSLEVLDNALPPVVERRNQLTLAAQLGAALVSRHSLSNGSGALASYALTTTLVSSGGAARFTHRFGAHGLLGVDLGYAFGSGGSVRYLAPDGSATQIRLQTHDAEAGLRLGWHGGVNGGVDLWLRAGALASFAMFDPDFTVRVPSDRLLAPTAGLGLDAPHLLPFGWRWLGVTLLGSAILSGRLDENLLQGRSSGTWGGSFGGNLTLPLWQGRSGAQLLVGATYRYTFTSSRFSGLSQRDLTATHATLDGSQHIMALTLGYGS
jgi:hypothetical protein